MGAVTASSARSQRTVENFLEGLHYQEEAEELTPKTQPLVLNDTVRLARPSYSPLPWAR